jgi:hypothetical protein
LQLRRSEIFVAPGFNPGKKRRKVNRPRKNEEKRVGLLSDGMEMTFIKGGKRKGKIVGAALCG